MLTKKGPVVFICFVEGERCNYKFYDVRDRNTSPDDFLLWMKKQEEKIAAYDRAKE